MQPDVGSLFNSPKIIAGKIDQSRVGLTGDQAALRFKVASLGILDDIFQAKRALMQALPHVITPTLSSQLRLFANKITPLSQLYLAPQGDPHVQEMLTCAENILKQLSPIGEAKVIEPLRKVTEIYRRVQKEREEGQGERFRERYRNSLMSLTSGLLYVSKETADKIAPLRPDGEVARGTQTGNSSVNFFEGIYWKVNPQPLYEQAFHFAGKIIFQVSSAPIEFVVLTREVKSKPTRLYIQGSKESQGIGMNKVLRDFPDLIAKLDSLVFARIACLHMAFGPQDAKMDNSQGKAEKDSEGNVVKLIPQEIDSDLWGVDNIVKSGPTKFKPIPVYSLNCRSFYWCLPQMYQSIHPLMLQQLKELLPASALVYWLYELWLANQKIGEACLNGNIDLGEMHKNEIKAPLCLVQDLIPRIFARLMQMKSFAQNATELSTPMELLKFVVPEVGYYYDIINERNNRDPVASFSAILHPKQNYDEVMKNHLSHLIVEGLPLSEYLNKCQAGPWRFEDDRDTPPEVAVERFLEILDFSTITEEDQSQLLKILKDFPLSQITLRNCTLTNDEMHSLMRSQRHLNKLMLIRCPKLTDDSLLAIAESNRFLELNIRECPGFSENLLATLSAYFPKFVFNDRRQTLLAKMDSMPARNMLHEGGLMELSSALEDQNPDWNNIQSQAAFLLTQNLAAQVTLRIIEKLTTKDIMLQIVKANRKDVITFFLSLSIPLTQTNNKGETFFHLCCLEGNGDMLEWLCQKFPDGKALEDQKENTPSHLAAQQGHLSCLSLLIRLKSPINANSLGISPLRLALERDHEEAARMLLDAGVDIAESNLVLACQKGMADMVVRMLEKVRHTDLPLLLRVTISHHQLACFKIILARMSMVNVADDKGVTPLMLASESDQHEMVPLLLEKGADTQAVNHEGLTAVHLAALAGGENVLRLLLDKPKPLQTRDQRNLLHLAALSRSINCVNLVSSLSIPLMQKDARGMTPAHYAAAAGHWTILEKLINQGFPIDYQENPAPESCLMLLLRGHHFEAAEKLIERGANLRAPNGSGLMPIHVAAKEGDVEMIQFLKQRGVDVNSQTTNSRKSSPLHIAAAGGHLAAIEALLDLGALVNQPDQDGKTPLLMTMQVGKEEAARLLVRRGADVRSTMKDGWTAAHYAAVFTHPQLLEYVLSLSPEFVHRRIKESGHTPLHQAMYQERLSEGSAANKPEEVSRKKMLQMEILKILLRYAADVNVRDDHDYVPLHLAAKMGRADFTQFLLDRGARVNVKNDNGRTPAEHADYMASKTTDENFKEAILRSRDLMQAHALSPANKAIILLPHQKSKNTLPKSADEQKTTFLLQIREAKFRPETIRMARRIEAEDMPESTRVGFNRSYERSLANQPMLKSISAYEPSQNYEGLSALQIVQKGLNDSTPETLEVLTWMIPLVTAPKEVLKQLVVASKENPMSEAQQGAICRLILHFRGHEFWMEQDFLREFSHALAKQLANVKGIHEGIAKQAIEFLDKPKRVFPPPSIKNEWKQKEILRRRDTLLTSLSEMSDKKNSSKREELVDQLTLSIMCLHKDLFTQVKVSELRPLPPGQSNEISVLAELRFAANCLTGNCLIFLLADKESRCLQNLKIVIDWMGRSLQYGDFHQSYALYNALAHPAILRLTKMRKKLAKADLELLMQCEMLFSSSQNYHHYTALLQKMLTPAIPALPIFTQQLDEKPTLVGKCGLLRYFKEQQAFAKSLILPQNPLSPYLLFCTPTLFPDEVAYKPKTPPEQPFTLPGEGFAWMRSLSIQPPKI